MERIKAEDMTQEQITHTFCSFCKYRCFAAGADHWGCTLDEKQKEEYCPYEQAVKNKE
ncbi:MAG: hypothetical protein K9L17_01685 [Clostridiales bacterium]|nr:hypothetical protein [Clostridiales bacterium]MCF8021402.1 hypothetical protein [Clostridiales bacterium]